MKLLCGSIVLVRFPFTNLEESKIRPALVLSSDVFNKGSDLILASISSKQRDPRFAVVLTQHDLVQGILHAKSYIRCGQLVTVEKRLISRVVAFISKEKLKEVRKITHSIV